MFQEKLYTFLINTLISIGAFFTPIFALFYGIFTLVFIDLISALMRNHKLANDKSIKSTFKSIESKKLRRTLVKAFVYILFTGLTFLIPMLAFGSTLYLPNIAFALISLIELRSIAENFDIVIGSSIFMKLFQKFRKSIENYVNSGIDLPEDKNGASD